MKRRHVMTLAALTAVALGSTAVVGLPQVLSASDDVDDATVSIRVLNQYIEGDSRSWCEVRIQVGEGEVPFSDGDTVYLWVYESDGGVGNDLIWQTDFTVNGSGSVDRTFDCTANFEGDGFGENLEIFAEARVEKDECAVRAAQGERAALAGDT